MRDYDEYTSPAEMNFGQTMGSAIYGFNSKSQKEFAKGFDFGVKLGIIFTICIVFAVILYVIIKSTY